MRAFFMPLYFSARHGIRVGLADVACRITQHGQVAACRVIELDGRINPDDVDAAEDVRAVHDGHGDAGSPGHQFTLAGALVLVARGLDCVVPWPGSTQLIPQARTAA